MLCAIRLFLILVIILVTAPPAPVRRGGEVLWEEDGLTLYRCGPGDEDICFNDSVGVSKVYVK